MSFFLKKKKKKGTKKQKTETFFFSFFFLENPPNDNPLGFDFENGKNLFPDGIFNWEKSSMLPYYIIKVQKTMEEYSTITFFIEDDIFYFTGPREDFKPAERVKVPFIKKDSGGFVPLHSDRLSPSNEDFGLCTAILNSSRTYGLCYDGDLPVRVAQLSFNFKCRRLLQPGCSEKIIDSLVAFDKVHKDIVYVCCSCSLPDLEMDSPDWNSALQPKLNAVCGYKNPVFVKVKKEIPTEFYPVAGTTYTVSRVFCGVSDRELPANSKVYNYEFTFRLEDKKENKKKNKPN